MHKRSISCVDLFCGAGGLTYGLVKSGIKVTVGIDLDPSCRYPFEANNPDAKFIENDIKNFTSKDINCLFDKRSIKLLAGCAPCQPFSTYSHRYDNKRDGKWELLNQFTRLVKKVSPELVTMENVPALVNNEVFHKFVRILKRHKYHVWYDVVDCSKYGVPQSRKRTVLLASKLGPVRMINPTRRKPKTVRETIEKLDPIIAGETNSKDKLHVASSLSDINLKRIRASNPGGTWHDWPKHLRAKCHQKNTGRTFISVYGRMSWDAVGPTVTTQCYGYGNGRFGHPEQDRAISLREAAMLQSFPKTYKFVGKGKLVEFVSIGRLIGNAVPVKLGEAIGKSLIRHISEYT